MAQILADRILSMDRNPDEYAKLQTWRTQFPTREACDADVRCMVSVYAAGAAPTSSGPVIMPWLNQVDRL